jgi:hypothetical protein
VCVAVHHRVRLTVNEFGDGSVVVDDENPLDAAAQMRRQAKDRHQVAHCCIVTKI